MIICPTTHNDWDWLSTFDEYYAISTSEHTAVRSILNAVIASFTGSDPSNAKFCFSYAEVGFLRQYLQDPSVGPQRALQTLQAAGSRFCLLGGGITTPDNLVCNSEVFIRNYLTGHEFLRSVNLIDHVFPVSWIPDDFGHSPQLPVLLEAMGMKAAGLSRIPGSPQPTPCQTQKADTAVRKNGLSFNWSTRDRSNVVTHFMPQTYYGITNYSVSDTTQAMNDFLHHHAADAWPASVIFATQGGDWQFPAASTDGSSSPGGYTWQQVIGATPSGGGITAVAELGTFEDYFSLLSPSADTLPAITLYAENYWTGHFASRPQLKIDHYSATRQLIGAEVLSSLLMMYGRDNEDAVANLRSAISAGWHLLVPSSHHDFVNGTSSDDIYKPSSSHKQSATDLVWDSQGQLQMLKQAVSLADKALSEAMARLASQVAASGIEVNGLPMVVFNQLGRDLPDTAVVECRDPSDGKSNYQVRIDGVQYPVQRSSDGTLLFQVPGMKSMSYRLVYLVPMGSGTPASAPIAISGDYALSNGAVNLTLSQSQGWAISSLKIAGNEYIQQGQYANQLEIWNDSGNIYQFGMEYLSECIPGIFSRSSYTMTGNPGTLLESGPIRWRAVGQLRGDGKNYTTRYDLIAGETMVRIATTGAAPEQTSVLASFALQNTQAQAGDTLEYGTCYHWENRNPEPSWNGLIFRASHDFASLASSSTGAAIGGVYHNGIPAWTIDGSTLRGCLLRNTPAGGRGAKGRDVDEHTQYYTLDVGPQVTPAVTGYPLRTAVYAHTPLRTKLLYNAIAATGVMPEQAQLAAIAQTDALISVAKPAIGLSQESECSLVLRLQQATDGEQTLDLDLPFLRQHTLTSATLVSALETPALRAPEVVINGTTTSFNADRALWTLRIDTTRTSAQRL